MRPSEGIPRAPIKFIFGYIWWQHNVIVDKGLVVRLYFKKTLLVWYEMHQRNNEVRSLNYVALIMIQFNKCGVESWKSLKRQAVLFIE